MPKAVKEKSSAPELMLVRAGHTVEARDAFTRALAGVAPEGAMPMSSMEASYGVNFDMNKPFAFSAGVAFVPVYGYLMHKTLCSWGYVTGYEAIRRQVAAALGDDDVHTIVLDVNSGGGACAGCFELADWLYAQRGQKKIEAMVDASCYSAAYAIASCADTITVTPTGGVGSIGVVATHYNMAGALEKWGEAVEFVYAGKYKIDGNQYGPLSEHAKEQLQFQVDHLYAMFIATVARNRGLSEEAVRNTEAAVYTAEQAVEIGLADIVSAPLERVTQIFNDATTGDIEMSLTPDQIAAKAAADKIVADKALADKALADKAAADQLAAEQLANTAGASQEAIAAAAAAAVAADRARCSAILSAPEALGRADLASHFAMSTTMTVDEAIAALAKAPAAAAVPAVPGTPAATNQFEQAMINSGSPAVGAHVDNVHSEDADTDVADILAAYSVATNTPIKMK